MALLMDYRKDPRCCTKCRNHGIMSTMKGHGGRCFFDSCVCENCSLISRQKELRRARIIRSHVSDITLRHESTNPANIQPTSTHSLNNIRNQSLISNFTHAQSSNIPSFSQTFGNSSRIQTNSTSNLPREELSTEVNRMLPSHLYPNPHNTQISRDHNPTKFDLNSFNFLSPSVQSSINFETVKNQRFKDNVESQAAHYLDFQPSSNQQSLNYTKYQYQLNGSGKDVSSLMKLAETCDSLGMREQISNSLISKYLSEPPSDIYNFLENPPNLSQNHTTHSDSVPTSFNSISDSNINSFMVGSKGITPLNLIQDNDCKLSGNVSVKQKSESSKLLIELKQEEIILKLEERIQVMEKNQEKFREEIAILKKLDSVSKDLPKIDDKIKSIFVNLELLETRIFKWCKSPFLDTAGSVQHFNGNRNSDTPPQLTSFPIPVITSYDSVREQHYSEGKKPEVEVDRHKTEMHEDEVYRPDVEERSTFTSVQSTETRSKLKNTVPNEKKAFEMTNAEDCDEIETDVMSSEENTKNDEINTTPSPEHRKKNKSDLDLNCRVCIPRIDMIQSQNLPTQNPSKELKSLKEVNYNKQSTKKDGLYPCSFCFKIFTTKFGRKLHTIRVHHIRVNANSKLSKAYVCRICYRELSSMNSLRRHITKLHKCAKMSTWCKEPKAVNKFYCLDCSQSFRWRSRIVRHMRQYHFGVPVMAIPSVMNRKDNEISRDFQKGACNRRIDHRGNMKQHLSAKHPEIYNTRSSDSYRYSQPTLSESIFEKKTKIAVLGDGENEVYIASMKLVDYPLRKNIPKDEFSFIKIEQTENVPEMNVEIKYNEEENDENNECHISECKSSNSKDRPSVLKS